MRVEVRNKCYRKVHADQLRGTTSFEIQDEIFEVFRSRNAMVVRVSVLDKKLVMVASNFGF